MNLYGSHPFYLVKDESIQNPHYYGVWLINSNAIGNITHNLIQLCMVE